MEYVVIGAKKQLGQELTHLLDEKNIDYTAMDRDELDITKFEDVVAVFSKLQPKVIFDCAAYTAVDDAEDVGKDINWEVNELGTKNLAEAAKRVGAKLVYISTDYVFDGKSEVPYLEDQATDPQNEYGRAKLAGEQAVEAADIDYYTIRTSWVFGKYGNNFVYTMRKLAENHDVLTVVNDQEGRPTWTRTLAEFMLYLVENNQPTGTYNLSNDNKATWFEFAQEILRDADVTVKPVSSDQFPTKAYRPAHSVLDLSKAKATGFKIPTWQEALAAFEQKL